MTTTAACFCATGVPVSADLTFSVVTCPQCGQAWAAWVSDGALVAQVKVDPGSTFEDVWHRLLAHGVRGFVGQWGSSEVKGAFAAVWSARLRWEQESRLGRWTVRLLGLPGLRWLDRAPFWVTARIFRRWGMPEHLQGRTMKTTTADRDRIRRMTWGRA